MSYDIHFIRRNDLTLDNIGEILEGTAKKSDPQFISKELKIHIKDLLASKGLKFEVFEKPEENYIELNFPSYQVAMLSGQISISLPYWDSNSNDGINREVKQIVNTLLENGFTGYDPQTEELLTAKYEFNKSFSESKTIVDKSSKYITGNSTLTYVSIGIIVLVVVIILWRTMK